MTREALPRFDLYGELEVSPSASVGAVESAYRSLVKQHHPDVATSDDARIKRLNLAREWLTDPDRRRRYDDSLRRSSPPADATASDEGAAPSFGPNAEHVRHFLAELRGLDRRRAQQVWDGRALAHAKGYSRARRAAISIGQAQRKAEWLFAREAALVIARGELGDSMIADLVHDVVADAAGALVVRDLLPRRDVEVLLLPWTWRGEPVSGRPVTAAAAPPAKPHSAAAADVAASAAKLASTVAPTTEALSAALFRWPTPARRAPNPAEPVAEAPAEPVAEAPTEPVAAAAHLAPAEPVAEAPAEPVAAAAPMAPAVPDPSVVPAPLGTTSVSEPARRTPRVSIDDLASSPWSAPPKAGPLIAPAGAATPRTAVRRAAVPTRAAAPRPAVYAMPPRQGSLRWLPVAAGFVAVLLIGAGLVGLLQPPSSQQVAGLTDAPTARGIGSTGGGNPASGAPATDALPASDQPPGDTAPDATGGPGGPAATPRPTSPGTATPAPTTPPRPTPAPTFPPTPPPPTPAPTPAPTTGALCRVITLLNHWTNLAQHQWAGAGFTGSVIFNPAPPPDYHIKWQSLAIGAIVPCSSNITVRDTAP